MNKGGRKVRKLVTNLLLLAALPVFAAIELDSKTSIKSIGLFKNGLGLVRHEFTISKPGEYVLSHAPTPINGTFWVEGDAEIVTRLTKVQTDSPVPASGTDIAKEFAGKEVAIQLKGKNPVTLVGRILKSHSPSRLVAINTQNGITYFDKGLIELISLKSQVNMKIGRPGLIFNVVKLGKRPVTVVVSYLARGIAWAPSYRIVLTSDKKMVITQKAIVRNELCDFNAANLKLISGFPNIRFANVNSPISPRTSWSKYISELNRRRYSFYNPPVIQNVAIQRAMPRYSHLSSASSSLPTMNIKGEGTDIHYQDFGTFGMKNGDVLMKNIATKNIDYERIVEWKIPDLRNEWGRYINEYQRRQNLEKYDNSPWDSIRFANQFPFPMTTAPATIYTPAGRILGESFSYWVNPGEKTILNITKALSIVTNTSENEIKDEREKMYIMGWSYQRCRLKGTLVMKNTRSKPVKILIRRKFSGKLLKADGSPKCQLLESGIYSVNERNELNWELSLRPGEERKINYEYSVLVKI